MLICLSIIPYVSSSEKSSDLKGIWYRILEATILGLREVGPATKHEEGYLQGGDKIGVVVSLTYL
jgi:hypothetical protein